METLLLLLLLLLLYLKCLALVLSAPSSLTQLSILQPASYRYSCQAIFKTSLLLATGREASPGRPPVYLRTAWCAMNCSFCSEGVYKPPKLGNLGFGFFPQGSRMGANMVPGTSNDGAKGPRKTAHCAPPFEVLALPFEIPLRRHLRYHVRRHSRSLGKKCGTQNFKFCGFLDSTIPHPITIQNMRFDCGTIPLKRRC